MRAPSLAATLSLLLLAGLSVADDSYREATRLQDEEKWLEAGAVWERMAVADSERPGPYHSAGVAYFFGAEIGKSLAAFDKFLEQQPGRAPYHWQRGLTLYYAKEYKKGRKQFETHQDVNSADVENAAWHYLCVARAESPEEAAKHLIPITGDTRVPMAQIHDLFAGDGSETHVLVAANNGSPNPMELRDRLCYAHLYLGLWHEAHGRMEEAEKHMVMAAFDYKMDHYMGRTAQVHAKLRGWKKKVKGEKKPAPAQEK